MSYYINMWIIPTIVSYVSTQIMCIYQKIPFFTDGTKTIPQKILTNVTSFIIGLSMIQLSVRHVVFLNGISLMEEAVRMGIYSLLVELWFYWSHRLLHENQWLYKNVHKEHHLEIVPSPIDSYILTPMETINVTMSFIIPLLCGFGITYKGLLTVYTYHLMMSLLVHGGIPQIDHHMVHHAKYNGNYSASYPLLDTIFGTQIEKRKKSISVSNNRNKNKPIILKSRFVHGKRVLTGSKQTVRVLHRTRTRSCMQNNFYSII